VLNRLFLRNVTVKYSVKYSVKYLALSGLSALLLTGFGPLSAEVSAQVFSSQRSPAEPSAQAPQVPGAPVPSSTPNSTPNSTPSSTVVQTTLEQSETLYLSKKNTYRYDLVVRDAAALGGQRLPVGAIIRGQFEPAEGGLVYVADSVEIADRIYPVRAVSELLRDRKDPRQTSTTAVLTDAAIGAAGGYIIGEVLGDAGVWEVVGGAAAGVVVGNTTAPFVVVIRPEDQIALYAN
jgi:hypothetical protein